MKTSVPEQAIFYYVKKFIDPSATNNTVRISRYTADITFCHRNIKYNVEYDAFSTHSKSTEQDIIRDRTFQEAGYTVIRMRDRELAPLPGVINITFDFQDYRKKSILAANSGINQFLALFNISERVNISDDLPLIRQLYREKNR